MRFYNKIYLMKNANSKLKKAINKQLAVAILLTIGLPLGITLIIIGATNKDAGALYKAMLGIGIAFTVLGFYGAPIAWVKYGPQKKYSRIIDAIKREGFRDTNDIAKHLSMQPADVQSAVQVCIEKQYLTDYTIDETRIVPLNNRPDDLGMYTVECPYCGGITQTSNNLQVKCEYCGRMIDVERK